MYKKSVKAKKKGNVFVLVVVLSMVLIMIGATITTAVMSTTTTNAYKKVDQDLYYATESGLQKAKSIVQDGHGPTVVGTPQVVPMGEYTSYGYIVTTTITKTSDTPRKYHVVSEAVKGTQKRKLEATLEPKKVKVPIPGENLLKYNYAATTVTIYTESFGNSFSKILSPDAKIIMPSGNIGAGNVTNKPVQQIEFNDTFEKKTGGIKIDNLDNFKNDVISKTYGKSVKYTRIEPQAGNASGIALDVYYIDCDYLYFKGPSVNINNAIFITSGDVYIAGEYTDDLSHFNNNSNFFKRNPTDLLYKVPLAASLTYNNSTIIGNNTYIAANTFSFTNPPLAGLYPAINNDIYKDKVDNVIQGNIPEWNDGSVGEFKDDWDYGDITEKVNY